MRNEKRDRGDRENEVTPRKRRNTIKEEKTEYTNQNDQISFVKKHQYKRKREGKEKRREEKRREEKKKQRKKTRDQSKKRNTKEKKKEASSLAIVASGKKRTSERDNR